MKTAIYPGSFDPITNGHLDLVARASDMFDKLIVAVAVSGEKSYLFDLDERVRLVTEATSGMSRVEVVHFEGLLANFVEEVGAAAIIRGLRAVSDFEYEFQLALMNRRLAESAETVFLMPSLDYVYLSSSLVKDVARNSGNIAAFVPRCVDEALRKKFSAER